MLNHDKIEFIMFGSKTVHANLNDFFPFNILDNLLIPPEVVMNLGFWFSSYFAFSCEVRNACKVYFVHIRDPRQFFV